MLIFNKRGLMIGKLLYLVKQNGRLQPAASVLFCGRY